MGIGASAGGLEAFSELLKHLPLDTGMGFVLVQHLDPQHESALTELLAKTTALPVREARNNQRVEPNHIYVIPPNTRLGIARGQLKVQPREPTRAGVRSIDSFFEALAAEKHAAAIGVILSGTATDGTMGLEAIKAEGGITFAQNESARYDSMPRSAVAAGCVDFVLSPKQIAIELARIARHPYVQLAAAATGHSMSSPSGAETQGDSARMAEEGEAPSLATDGSRGQPRLRAASEDEAFKKILLLVRNHSGVDFSLYKTNTIQRRIRRRMILHKLENVGAYVRHLRNNRTELAALYSDLLIGVTSFFRNAEAFDYLQRHVFPRILPERRDDPLRIWVLGCSTGQEAYSLAIAFTEFADRLQRAPKLQVFATDLNNTLLDKARNGLYSKNLVADVSPERLRRFFVEEEGGYRIIKPLRDSVVFARQNLLSDPPFSRMDLISCRNLLIYIEPGLQKKVMPTFHYALRPKGCLFLGASESIGPFTDLFEPLDRRHRIYARKAGASPMLPARITPGAPASPKTAAAQERPRTPRLFQGEFNTQREADRVTRNRYAPPSVIVSNDFVVAEFRGDTGPFLKSPAGHASFNVLKMAREGLMLPLRAALNQARKENKLVRREKVSVTQNGVSRPVNFEVVPLKNPGERCYLIFFEEATAAGRSPSMESRPETDAKATVKTGARDKRAQARRIRELETELAETRDHAQSLQEQQDAALEELQASNEEVTSANEELQSVNEELETSKEELESSNEELTTVNEEMNHRNAELSRLNGDLINFQSSTKLAILLLGRDLTIRRFSAQAEKQFHLIAGDIGRSIGSLRHTLSVVDLDDFVSGVIAHVQEREREVRDKDGRWFLLRVRPYFTIENKVDGAVLVLVDITDRKKIEQEVVAAREYAEATIRTARDPLVVLRADLRVNTANEAFYRKFATTPEKTEGRLVFEICDGAWEIPPLRDLLESILPQRRVFNDYEVSHEFPDLGRRTMLLNARQLEQTENAAPMILLAIEDVTEKQHAAEVAAAFAAIVNSSDDAIVSKSLDGIINTWNEVAERLFGYSAQEAIGQPITLIIPPDRLEEEPKILSRIKRGEPVLNFETVRVRKDGTPVEISLTVSPNGDFVTVRAIQQGVITASDGRSIDTARVRHLSHGYAVTSHKSQSKTADHVIVAAERLNQKSAYVACSRGRLSCSVHAPDKANLLACLADGERPAAVEVFAKEMRKETVQPRDKAWPALNRVRAPARTPLQRAMSFEWWRETLRQWCHPVPGHFGPNTNRQDRTR